MKVNKNKVLTFFAFALVITVIAGIACSNEPVMKQGNSSITEGVMTTSVDDNSKPTGEVKTSFTTDTPSIYCSFKLAGVVQEDMIKATWIYVKGEAKDKENMIMLQMYDIVPGNDDSYYLAFFMDKPTSGWDKGEYKVVLSINNREKLTVPFEVE